MRKIKVLSPHRSHIPLRATRFNKKVLIRLGSTDEEDESKFDVVINSPNAIRCSSSKIIMKTLFDEEGVRTPEFIYPEDEIDVLNFTDMFFEEKDVKFVTKSEFGSRNKGNKIWDSVEKMILFLEKKQYQGYIIEKYYNYGKEYRLHIDRNECFYTCRKVFKPGTPSTNKWYRNDSNCSWLLETNPKFDKPSSWHNIVRGSIKALNAVGLDIGAVDVRVDNNGNYMIIEINSAPAFGEITLQKYIQQIKKIAKCAD